MISSRPYCVCQLALLVTVLASAGLFVEAATTILTPVHTNKSSHKEALDVLEIQGCPVAVHKAPGSKSNFILEPMLCWKAGMEKLLCEGFDYLRARHFLRVPVLLTDPAVPDKAKRLLQKLFPGSVQFIDAASVRFQFIKLNQSADIELEQQLVSSAGRSYLILRVHCSALEHCQSIRQGLATQPSLMFERLRFSLSSDAGALALKQAVRSVSAGSLVCESRRRTAPGVIEGKGDKAIVKQQPVANQSRVLEVGGQLYLLVQQRWNGEVSFQRNWTEYENGFGTLNGDYWIGLRLLHSLTKPSRVLRIEVVRFRNTTFDRDFFHAEYSGVRVGPPPLYMLSYSAFNRVRSSTLGDALAESRNRGFSTSDRNTWPDSCSLKKGGGGGWWFGSSCGVTNPNGVFYGWNAGNESGIRWGYLDSLAPNRKVENLKYIRILLQL